NIGAQLSVVAEAIGFDVYYYDLVERLAMGNATKCSSLQELLETVEIVTLHVDGRTANKNLIGEEQLQHMKEGSILLNLSRGQVVDVEALKKHISSGKIKGAGIDVFPKEPKTNNETFESELRGLPNVILTPHIGGSTQEAQENIGNFVPGKIIEYINTGGTTNSVNFPNLQLPSLENAHRLIHIHHNKPGIIAHINKTLAANDINIVGQYLKTNETIGYVITDIDKAYDADVIKELKGIEGTIKFRVLY
ncbi:NAD(P)-dependent oxidoreductase, partial [Autumnicola edwardsiae]